MATTCLRRVSIAKFENGKSFRVILQRSIQCWWPASHTRMMCCRSSFLGPNRLVSTSVDRSVKLWDTDQIRPLGQLSVVKDLPIGIVASVSSSIQVVTIEGESVSIAKEAIERISQDAMQRVASATSQVSSASRDAAVANRTVENQLRSMRPNRITNLPTRPRLIYQFVFPA